jgi:hypothetical protein
LEERLPQFFTPIAFNEDVLSLAQFVPYFERHKKELSNGTIFCKKVSRLEYQMKFQGNQSNPFSHVHEFQNEYAKLTATEITPNLFGINP